MKKKYRRAVCKTIMLPLVIIGFIAYYISEAIIGFNTWLKTKLRVYDTDPDGRQCTFRSKPLRRQWASGWCWEPSDGGNFIGEEGAKALMEMLGLPKLTWDDEPYKFTVSKPKRNGNG